VTRLISVTERVLVRTSEFCTTTTTVVVADDDTCLVVDPGVTPGDIDTLVADIRGRGLRVVAGFSTHPHWDHLLWSDSLGTVPRFATPTAVQAAADDRERSLQLAQELAPGHDPRLFGRLTPLASKAVPWDGPHIAVIEHRAHATGHAALHVTEEGVLLTGDMCSDIEIPLLDLGGPDPVGDYRYALELFSARADIEHVVPGHGSVGNRAALQRLLDADRRYLDELEVGGGSDDPRLTEDWLVRDHQAQLQHVRRVPSKRVR
jgi:glyoxylase-like metal-dependent hydrolase (beta-lactamase superfamily II)